MNIAFFANTPAQVHFNKNIIYKLKENKHNVVSLARDHGETKTIFDELHLDNVIYSKPPKSKIGKCVYFPMDVLNAYHILKNKNIELIFGFGLFAAYASLLMKKPTIIFNDSEPSINRKSYSIQFKLFMPSTDAHWFQERGIETILIGTGRDDTNAHAADEFVYIEDLINTTKLYALTALNYLK